MLGPAWVRSLDAGALCVTRSFLGGNPPAPDRVTNARLEIRRLFADFDPPRPDTALAAGGTARAIGRVVGRRFGVDRLEELAATLAGRRAESVTESVGVTPDRARTLLGGTLVLAEVARRLGRDLEVARGGLREGAALALARAEAAVA